MECWIIKHVLGWASMPICLSFDFELWGPSSRWTISNLLYKHLLLFNTHTLFKCGLICQTSIFWALHIVEVLYLFWLNHLTLFIILRVWVVVLARSKIHLVLVLSLVAPLDYIRLLSLNLMELENIAEILPTTSDNMVSSQFEIKLIGFDVWLLVNEIAWLIDRRNSLLIAD